MTATPSGRYPDLLPIRATLTEAGWHPGRRVDTRQWVDALTADGYRVSSAAERILAEFGGLSVAPPFRAGSTYGPCGVMFVPLQEHLGEQPRIADREAQLGQRLCPIGEWCDGEYMLLVADDGHVYGETTFQVLDLGPSLAHALHNIIVRDRPLLDITDDLPGETPRPAAPRISR